MRGTAGKPVAFVAGICLLLILALTAGCGSGDETSSTTTVSQQKPRQQSARAELHPVGGSKASGVAVFTNEGYGGTLKVRVKNLEPAQGGAQYGLWQLDGPDSSSVIEGEDMKSLATYPVGSNGRLTVEFAPPPLAIWGLERGELTYFLVTRIDDRERLNKSIIHFNETGAPPDLGPTVARGIFKGSLVGAAE